MGGGQARGSGSAGTAAELERRAVQTYRSNLGDVVVKEMYSAEYLLCKRAGEAQKRVSHAGGCGHAGGRELTCKVVTPALPILRAVQRDFATEAISPEAS